MLLYIPPYLRKIRTRQAQTAFLYEVTSQDYDLDHGLHFIILKTSTVKTMMI